MRMTLDMPPNNAAISRFCNGVALRAQFHRAAMMNGFVEGNRKYRETREVQ
jgi:hypothetical protein